MMYERPVEGGVPEDCFEPMKISFESKENKMSVDVSRSTKSSANRSKPRDISGRFLSASNKRNSRKEKTDIANNDIDNSHGRLDISAADLLRICKPVSVRVIRLPDPAIKEMAVSRVEAPTKKRKRMYHWRHGADMTKRRRRLKLERLRLRMRMNEASSCDGNNVNNATEQINGYNEKSVSTVREITVSERQEYNLSFTAESEKPQDFASTENPASVNLQSFCETENQPIDESNRASNRVPGNRRIFKPVEKRKVSLVFEHEEFEQELGKSLPSKRRKNLRAPSAEISSSTEEIDDLSEDVCPQREKILTEKTDTLFPKTPEKHCRADVMVVVNRLDISYNPLIQKWKDKVEKSPAKCPDLSSSTDTINKSLPTPFENVAEVTDTNSGANTPDRESRVSNGVTMILEGNADASEDDDDEIMGFLATRRRARSIIDSSDSDNLADDEEHRKTVSSGIGVETPSSKSSEWVDSQETQNLVPGEKLQSLVIDSSETLPNVDRSSNKSRSCKSRTGERINDYSDSEDIEIRRAPITRSKSRAAMGKSSHEYETDSSESQDCEKALQTTMAEIHEVGTEFLNDPEENLSNSSESKSNRENEDPLEVTSRVDSDIEITDAMEVEDDDCDTNHIATDKLTAMKNVMVVLTRLEDLYNDSKDYEYFEPLVGFPASRDSGLDSNFSQETAKDKTNVDNDFEHFEGDAERNSQPFGFVSVPQFTPDIPRNGGITNESRTIRSSEETSEKTDSITLNLEDQSSRETIESDGEFTLVLDETEKESSEESTCPLSEGIHSNESVNNESAINKNTHKCIRCNTIFNDTLQLEEHKKSNVSCTIDLHCTLCQTSFVTLVELAKHRLNCAEKGSQKSVDDQSLTIENTAEAMKKKQTKQQNQKNAKKIRPRIRCRDDNLTCSMCSTRYESKSALSEHIFKHSSAELQEAYITAKAKRQLVDEAKSNEALTKQSEKHDETLADKDKSLDIAINDPLSNKAVENLSQIVVRNVRTIATPLDSDNTSKSSATTVCACHRDDELTASDNGELQIEMVLLCKYCQVLFRRHDCLEIHYRTSTNCAIDRTRERWPKFYCANCKSTLDTWADMRNHLQVHSDRNSQGRVRFVCNICRVIFFGFGALFFTHWHNHVKDTMFVASRHNFPKISVQPMDGTQKLPAGIRTGENFIFVAEHVCASCKTAFSTRKELDVHQDTGICRRKNSMPNPTTIYVNGVTPSDNNIIKPTVITIMDDDVETGNDSGFHTPVEILNNQELATIRRIEPREPLISVSSLRNNESNASNDATQMSLLQGVLETSPRLRDVRARKTNAKQSGPKRALEDPLVNVVLSNASSTNSSVSLVFDQPGSNATIPENDNPKTNTYQILLPDQGPPGTIKMVLSRNSLSNANEPSIVQSSMNQSSSEVHDKTLTADRTKSSSSLNASKSIVEEATKCRLNQTQQSVGTSDLNTSNPLVKAPVKVPEIIDIDDEADNAPKQQESINPNSPNKAKKTKRKTVKSFVGQSPKIVPSLKNDVKKSTPKKVNGQSTESTSGSETNSTVVLNRSGTSDYSSAIAASKISFEESRWMTMRASAHFDNADQGATKMQGFLRVKNLSELQAVKSHVCPTCEAAFESYTSLVEHGQVHLSDPLGKNVQYPKGMAAVLVLPDPSERPKTPKKVPARIHEKETQKVGRPLQLSSYASTPPLNDFIASRGTSMTNQTPVTISKKKSTSKAKGQRVTLAPRIETMNSLDSGSAMMDLVGQRLTDNPLSNVTNTGSIPSTNVLQNQDNLLRHQQTMSSSTALNQDASCRNGSAGYHVLPPMVILPSSQVSKQQYGTIPQRNSSINNLPTSGHLSNSPLTYQNNNVNKYTCNICHTFRCDSMETFTSHLTKHYTGWNTTNVAQDPLTTNVMSTTIPVPTTIGIAQDSACLGPNYVTTGLESAANHRVFQNWTVKNTPQGPVLVTPFSSQQPSCQQTTSTFLTNNIQPAQIVYRCLICKSALYRNYSPLRDHLLLVHGMSNSNIENNVQKKYQCTQCPGTTALFDSEEKYRQHADTNHTHACPNCRRSFVSFLGLKYHIEHCRISVNNDRNSYGANC